MILWWYNILIRRKKKFTVELDFQKLGVIVLVVFFLLIAFLYVRAEELANTIQKSSARKPISSTQIPSLELIPSATPTPVAVKKVYVPTVDPDPIITCNIHASCGGGSRQLKKSVCDSMNCCLYDTKCGGPKFVSRAECNNSICCQVGSVWSMYPSKDSCTQAQNNYSSSTSSSANNYLPCVIYYPALGYSQTYNYISPEQCQQWKNNVSSSTTQVVNTPTPYRAPTASPEEIQALIDQRNKAISDCKSGVRSIYNREVQNCYNEIGVYCSSCSAMDACLEIAKNKADKGISNCENL